MGRCTTVVATCLCLLFAGARAADAQFGRNKVHYDRLDFRVIQTEHFDIYYYAEKEDAARQAGRLAERWYTRFSALLGHRFEERQPIVLYASHPHFSQTNLTSGTPSEGTGGFIEAGKSRIALPFAAGLGETDHVIGHEIAHAFQIAVAKSVRQNAFSLPGWFIEGMAEYLSLGAANTHTAMWLRDAAIHDRLPKISQLDDPRFFPYRFGHAFWSFLAGRYGDQVLGRVLRARARSPEARLEEATGTTIEELTAAWHASIPDGPVTDDHVGDVSIGRDDGRTMMHIAPAISPDGSRVMFMSERDRLSVDLFMADATDGRVVRKIVSTAARSHFDSLQYIHSAGAWDPEGRRFAMTAVSGGNPVLVIIDTTRDDQRSEVGLDELSEIYNPSWSPDGTRIVFSALAGGYSDVYIYDLRTDELRPLTADPYADLHPAWSPDGRTIAVATDRFTTDLGVMDFGPMRIGLIDLESGVIRPLTPSDEYDASIALGDEADESAEERRLAAGALSYGPYETKQVSPQWAPGGEAVYFVSDPDGISNVYRVDLPSGTLRQMTDVQGGISGITATSPSLAVAADAGTLAFSVYRAGRYEIDIVGEAPALARATSVPEWTGAPLAAAGGPSTHSHETAAPAAGVEAAGNAKQLVIEPRGEPQAAPPPESTAARKVSDDEASRTGAQEPAAKPQEQQETAEQQAAGESEAEAGAADPAATRTLEDLLADPEHGLPESGDFPTEPYDDRLHLESFAQPYIGASTGGAFGSTLRGSFGVNFGDVLKDRQLQTLFQVGTRLDDLAAQIAYINRKDRWNWGITAGFVPSRFHGARRALERDGDLVTRETSHLRYLHLWAGVTAHYNIDRARRIEVGARVRRTGFTWQTITRVIDAEQRKEVSRELNQTEAGQAVYLAEAQAAFVYDTAVFGPTSPILGQRLRLEVEPALGGLAFADVRVDARRYFMPVRPITIAARVQHTGRYGRDASDPRLTPLVYGLQSLVRGYDLTYFAADQCGPAATECSLLDELRGSRLALLNLEVRAPLFGLFTGDFDYGPLPVELIGFADMGFLWTKGDGRTEQHRFRSVGFGARTNLGGFVFEATAARPFDRTGKGWTFSLLLRPGW